MKLAYIRSNNRVHFDLEFLNKDEERQKEKKVQYCLFRLLPREAVAATALFRLLSLFLLSVFGFTEALEEGFRP
jgi:hypothetical protein